ncbi:MAG: hypothetical protein IPP08_02160 [Chlorobiota bacterium]|nr:hypothetical protein [Chlorobiota bacterium]QQS67000.1 MAG: hypothetical protein IPP08_02160 [Chlorobiota bacterium]
MIKLLIFLGLLSIITDAKSQQEFSINNGSENYYSKITVEKCEDGTCSGKGTISIFVKSTKSLFQILSSDDLYFSLDVSNSPSVNVVELYGEQSPLIFDDFNFDGTEDLAIRNGNNSGYSGPSYDVYVYNANKKQFVFSSELTKLVTDNLGMFLVDHTNKRITTFSKSGCCWHLTTQYVVVPKKGLVKVYELIEDATNSNGKTVLVTTSSLINGKWIKSSKKFKMKEYYK